MTLAELRDLVIIAFALLGIGATILFVVLSIIIFRKLSSVLDSTKKTLGTIRGTSSFVSDLVAKPVIRVVSFTKGARKAGSVLVGLSRKRKEGKKDG